MKKTAILFGALLGLVSITANAQTGTATANLTVTLKPIQTIIVNTGTENVNLLYNDAQDYVDGAIDEKKDHLKIYSTGSFAVKVRSQDATLPKNPSSVVGEFAASDITLLPSAGSSPLASGVDYGSGVVTLTSTDQPFFSSSVGGINKTVTVEYKSKAIAEADITKYFASNTNTVYTTTVIYTIEAQ